MSLSWTTQFMVGKTEAGCHSFNVSCFQPISKTMLENLNKNCCSSSPITKIIHCQKNIQKGTIRCDKKPETKLM